jgi:hypothetical protein
MLQTESTLYLNKNSNKLIVAFGSLFRNTIDQIRFEFVNTINKTFPNYSRLYLIDTGQCWYHKGLKGHTHNIGSTIRYLRNIINKYSEVTFIGISMGGYAAILFGSLLNIKNVIAFMPQTIINSRHTKTVKNKFFNLKKFINNTTNYQIYGDLSCPAGRNHSINHCNNINIYDNVTLITRDKLNMKEIRDSGELENIIKNVLN